MKETEPNYEKIRSILRCMHTHLDYATRREDLEIVYADIRDIEALLDKIRMGYVNAAKKSKGPRVKTAKKARASRSNLKIAAVALSPEERSERARKAVLVRWAKAKEKEKKK